MINSEINVSIVIVTMNHLKFLKKLLHSLYETNTPNISFEVILVDNCSIDDTVSFIRNKYPQIKLIVNTSIKGFAFNSNLGMKNSHGKYVLLLNPDIILLPKAIDNLYSFMEENKDVGIAAPMLLNADLTYQNSVRRFIDFKVLYHRILQWGNDKSTNPAVNYYLMGDLDKEKTQPVDWAIGAALFVRRDAIETVGMLDENFFLYIEDQDWCYRMWQKGWKVYYVPNSKMIHDHQRASIKNGFNNKTLYHAKSLGYFFWKHGLFPSREKKLCPTISS
jgi:hypothetical protein